MYDRIFHRIQALVLQGRYILTLHAQAEMDEDWLRITRDDIESAILTGQIVERQRDAYTHDWKYVIEGVTVVGDGLGVVVQVRGDVIIITVYLIR